jgi:hypothetical protein
MAKTFRLAQNSGNVWFRHTVPSQNWSTPQRTLQPPQLVSELVGVHAPAQQAEFAPQVTPHAPQFARVLSAWHWP